MGCLDPDVRRPTGHGLGLSAATASSATGTATQSLNSPHNEWLRFFAEQGIAGGLVGLALVLTGLARLARVPGWLGTGILAAFLSYVIAASFNNPLLFIQISIVVFTIVGTGWGWGRQLAVATPG